MISSTAHRELAGGGGSVVMGNVGRMCDEPSAAMNSMSRQDQEFFLRNARYLLEKSRDALVRLSCAKHQAANVIVERELDTAVFARAAVATTSEECGKVSSPSWAHAVPAATTKGTPRTKRRETRGGIGRRKSNRAMSISERQFGARSSGPDLDDLQALLALGDAHHHLLPGGERVHAVPAQNRCMDEDVSVGRFTRDEAIAALVVVPFDDGGNRSSRCRQALAAAAPRLRR